MKKDIALNIELYKDGTVMLEDSNFKGHTYDGGTVEFTATIDGRRKTFDPMEALERAGLVTTEHDESMFPDYKATDKLHKAFTSTGLVLGFTDNINTRERLNSLMENTGVIHQQAFTNLKNAGVTDMADVYQLSDEELKTIICK